MYFHWQEPLFTLIKLLLKRIYNLKIYFFLLPMNISTEMIIVY